MELIINLLQFFVTLLGFCLSGIRYLRHRTLSYFLLICFYGCFALGSLYWTLYLLLFSETPRIFYVSEFGWVSSVIFLYLLQYTLSSPEERSFSCRKSLLVPLQKVHEEYAVSRIVVSTYISTSIYGKEAMDELFSQIRKIYMNDSLVDDQKVFNKQIAFNVIPQAGEFIGEETHCEWAMNAETKKVFGGGIKVHANCAVIPAFIGCGQFINVECEHEVDVDEVRS